MNFIPSKVIQKKRNNIPLSKEEIKFFIEEYTKGDLPDYQMSALLMAIYFNGMNNSETSYLTKIMKDSGDSFDFTQFHPKVVDKHSTGGVGDKTSMILAPIVASCGLKVPMIAGRGLGHTGGTLDKLESLPGFNTQLKQDDFVRIVSRFGFAIMGQTKNICPADKKIYALRDVTATVESLPLICASIMSKKLSEGIKGLVLDVKFGDGAFMKTAEQAKELGMLLKQTGENNDVSVHALITNMNQPLGSFVGNSLEMHECIEILKGNTNPLFADTLELSLELSAHMLVLGKACKDIDEARILAQNTISSGKAFELLESVCFAQGAKDGLKNLPVAKNVVSVLADKSGYISHFSTQEIGYLGIKIKAGRLKSSDKIDPSVGFEFFKKVGDPITKGELLGKIHLNSDNSGYDEELKNYIHISEQEISPSALIHSKVI